MTTNVNTVKPLTIEPTETPVVKYSSDGSLITLDQWMTKNNKKPMSPQSNIKEKRKSTNGRVNALRTTEQIQRVKDYFLKYDDTVSTRNRSYGIRNYCIVVFGLNTALRVSDILMFTMGEVIKKNGELKSQVTIKEGKTGKKRVVYFNENTKDALNMYLETLGDYDYDDFLFPSNKKKWDESKQRHVKQPISARSFWYIMNKCGEELGLHDENINLGTHSMRKTWARHTLKNNADKPLIRTAVSEALNHASEKTTYTYADISADEQKELFMTNRL